MHLERRPATVVPVSVQDTSTIGTSPVLPQPELRPFEALDVLRNVSFPPCLKIRLPCRVIGIEVAFDRWMTSDRNLRHLKNRCAFAIRKEPRLVLDREKVLPENPRSRLVPVAPSYPIPQPLSDIPVNPLKCLLADHMPVEVRPTPYHRIQPLQQRC